MTHKEGVLDALLVGRGAPVSGQEIADSLGVTRAAVWKAVQALREEGYSIRSSTNRGYRLEGDPFCARLVRSALGDPALPIHIYRAVDSTNEQAKRLLAGGEKDFLVLAEEQTAGRGRRGRDFYSPAGAGLYMTLVRSGQTELADMLGVTAYAAVCAVRAIRALTGKKPRIKWVNDLLLDGKKICGILTEAVSDFETGTVSALLVGLGINLRACAVPPELEGVMGHLGCDAFIKNELAAEIARGLHAYIPGQTEHLEEYRQSSDTLGKSVTYRKDGAAYTGTAVDIDPRGGLVLRRTDGVTETLRSGTFLPEDAAGASG